MVNETYENFSGATAGLALHNLISEGYSPLYPSEIIDRRLEGKSWGSAYCTPAVRVTGKTKEGKKVVVYASIPNHFSKPGNIEAALKTLKDGAAIYPQKEFYELIAQEDGKKVFVLDHAQALSAQTGDMRLEDALDNIHTVPLIGLQAAAYFEQYQEMFSHKIEIYCKDDMDIVARARPVFIDLRLHKLKDGSTCGSLGGGSFGKPATYIGRRAA